MDTWLLMAVFTLYACIMGSLFYLVVRLLRLLTAEMRAQTAILQRAFRTQIARNDADVQQEILHALLSTGVYADRAARDSLLAALPPAFTDMLPRSDAAGVDLKTIILRAWRWRGDGYILDKLLTEAINTLDGSDAGQTLMRIKGELDH